MGDRGAGGRKRQAVVVIHGIGEQRPMQTLRGLVRGLGLGQHHTKRDRYSGSYELWRLVLPPWGRRRRATDFYELYWAHLMDEARGWDALLWAVRLLWRKRAWKGTPIAVVLTVLSVLSVGLPLLALVLMVLAPRVGFVQDLVDRIPADQPLWLAAPVSAVTTLAGWFLGRFVCDAARYLTPRPRNVAARQEIRERGVALLRSLHESGKYDRIVVLGHSLGSVIGYDVLHSYWDECRSPDGLRGLPQPQVEAFERAASALESSHDAADVDRFQEAQYDLWREQRERGCPWLVSDFVTVGSPLAHAEMILGSNTHPVRNLVHTKELASCPPPEQVERRQVTHGFYRSTHEAIRPDGSTGPWSSWVPDHAAVFTCTRWTNLYVPIRWGFLGDLVGGEVAPVLGRGIRDVPVRVVTEGRGRMLANLFPRCHTGYWEPRVPQRKNNRARVGLRRTDEVSTAALGRYLALDRLGRRHHRPGPDGEPPQPGLSSVPPAAAG